MAGFHLLLLCFGVYALTTRAMARPLGVDVDVAETPLSRGSVISSVHGVPSSLEVAAAAAPAQSVDGGRPDKSIAGAEVILGGFATAVLAIIFCYIRVTRKHGQEKV
ncbi:hypothetical protein Cni_G18924 [Canna indica]|uniref:Uncharacterized protein n=1 Tax=Canna indica TaxID=4628 RepID=A0AAQ3QJ90_9LILI|nr:hypothetical protein Cni_G18924 [Canna indica]